MMSCTIQIAADIGKAGRKVKGKFKTSTQRHEGTKKTLG